MCAGVRSSRLTPRQCRVSPRLGPGGRSRIAENPEFDCDFNGAGRSCRLGTLTDLISKLPAPQPAGGSLDAGRIERARALVH